MNRFIRDENSGAAVLADKAAVEEYLQKKSSAETIDVLRDEINRLRQDLEAIRNNIDTKEKR